ncbi:hypothetical protein [Pseudomonas putida]|uniref:hypothetical protein n=1 Tax=Pseudomonas putida TaxID=303 RepID=UPI002FBDAC93
MTQTVIKGGSLGDNLMQSLVSQAGSVVAAVAFNSVGSYALEQQIKAEGLGDSSGAAFWREGGEGRIALHALTGARSRLPPVVTSPLAQLRPGPTRPWPTCSTRHSRASQRCARRSLSWWAPPPLAWPVAM